MEPMRALPHSAGLACLLVLLAGAAPPAHAQGRFSWQLQGGGVLPLSAYVHDGLRVVPGDTGTTGGEQLVAELVDQYNNPGFQVGMTVLLDRFELRYMFHMLTWDRTEAWCTGDGAAVHQSPSGLDDALVPVFLHVISVGYRIPLDVGPDSIQVYLGGAPGLAISSYNDVKSTTVLGFNLSLGGGVDWFVTRGFGLGLEARYNLLLTAPVEAFQTAANRAEARGESAAQAVLDAFQYATLTLGLQVNFR
jgi:hypothetical protein